MTVSEDAFPLEKTLCKNCSNRFSRLLIPIDYEYWDIDPEELDMDDDQDIIVETHTCLISNEPLDGIVRSCSAYSPISNSRLFSSDTYINPYL